MRTENILITQTWIFYNFIVVFHKCLFHHCQLYIKSLVKVLSVFKAQIKTVLPVQPGVLYFLQEYCIPVRICVLQGLFFLMFFSVYMFIYCSCIFKLAGVQILFPSSSLQFSIFLSSASSHTWSLCLMSTSCSPFPHQPQSIYTLVLPSSTSPPL